MARTEPTVTTTIRGAGILLNPTAVAAADDCMFVNTGQEIVYIGNASGSTANIVFETPATILSDAYAIADYTTTVLTATARFFGPFPTAIFNQTGTDVGKVYLNTDQNITVQVIRLGSVS
jgi:hypothetical protein